MICGPVKDNGIWKTRYIHGLYTLYDELNIVQVIKIGRMRWLVQRFRMQVLDPCRMLTLFKPEGTLFVGKQKLG
jgi:hypothetical protein